MPGAVEHLKSALARVQSGLTEAARAEQAALEQSLSVDVERDFAGNVVVRSAPGQPPRRETGELVGNVALDVRPTTDGIKIEMSADRPSTPGVALTLEIGGDGIQPRPYMKPSFERFETAADGAIKSALR
jgi:hypothetical protein